MTEKQKQQYLTAQQAREIATTPYREVFTKIKMAAESGKCSLTIGFCTDVSEWVKLKKKCSAKKIPIFVVDFEKSRDSLAILTYEDLQFLIELAYKDNS